LAIVHSGCEMERVLAMSSALDHVRTNSRWEKRHVAHWTDTRLMHYRYRCGGQSPAHSWAVLNV